MLLRATETNAPGGSPTEAQAAIVREAEDYLDGVRVRVLEGGVPAVEIFVWYVAESVLRAAATPILLTGPGGAPHEPPSGPPAKTLTKVS